MSDADDESVSTEYEVVAMPVVSDTCPHCGRNPVHMMRALLRVARNKPLPAWRLSEAEREALWGVLGVQLMPTSFSCGDLTTATVSDTTPEGTSD